MTYDFCNINGEPKKILLDRIDQATIVSFDLFDTLLMRKVSSYADVFEILETKLVNQKIFIPDFARLRLSAEKECSKNHAPTLVEIYEDVLKRAGGSFLTAVELAGMEWEIDRSVMVQRCAVCDIYRDAVKKGKRVVITTDSYYSVDQIRQLLSQTGLDGYVALLVSGNRSVYVMGE